MSTRKETEHVRANLVELEAEIARVSGEVAVRLREAKKTSSELDGLQEVKLKQVCAVSSPSSWTLWACRKKETDLLKWLLILPLLQDNLVDDLQNRVRGRREEIDLLEKQIQVTESELSDLRSSRREAEGELEV